MNILQIFDRRMKNVFTAIGKHQTEAQRLVLLSVLAWGLKLTGLVIARWLSETTIREIDLFSAVAVAGVVVTTNWILIRLDFPSRLGIRPQQFQFAVVCLHLYICFLYSR